MTVTLLYQICLTQQLGKGTNRLGYLPWVLYASDTCVMNANDKAVCDVSFKSQLSLPSIVKTDVLSFEMAKRTIMIIL